MGVAPSTFQVVYIISLSMSRYEHLFIYQLFLAVPGHKTPLPAPAGTQIHLGGRAGPE